VGRTRGADGSEQGRERGGREKKKRTGAGQGPRRALVIFSPLYLYFADMSSHVDIVNPTCSKWGNVITHKIR
jgi:hypothetical protein